jgi:transposase
MALTPYVSKLMIYHEVHQLARDGFSIRYISSHLELNWRTVKRLLDIKDDREYEQYLRAVSDKHRRLEPYESFVKSRLELYRDTSAAQMHDWLKEHFTDFPTVSARTVFNFVMWIRQKYQLAKVSPIREYAMVPENPYGQQAQVDFGEYSLRNGQGKRIKVYFFVLVLSRSRYKFVYFSTERFTAETAIDAHERAFAFILGIPIVIVYDQDRVFLVDENSGELLLTESFKSYRQSRNFKLHFCRRSDPESKGKVENSVRYIKQNFLYNRVFTDIDLLNTEAMAWLARTANGVVHSGTKKVPATEWEIEKPFLHPYQAIHLPKPNLPVYAVRKDNSFSYKGNFYSLPAGTYRGRASKVLLDRQGAYIVISTPDHRELCRHLVGNGRGEKIINNHHRRPLSPAIGELEERFYAQLSDPDKGRQLVSAIRSDKPRYIRDQLLILLDTASTYPATVMLQALHYCCQHAITGASDVKDVAAHYHGQSLEVVEEQLMAGLRLNPLNRQIPDEALIQPATSSIQDYNLF